MVLCACDPPTHTELRLHTVPSAGVGGWGEDWKGLTVPTSPQAPLELLQAFSRAGWACRTPSPQQSLGL